MKLRILVLLTLCTIGTQAIAGVMDLTTTARLHGNLYDNGLTASMGNIAGTSVALLATDTTVHTTSDSNTLVGTQLGGSTTISNTPGMISGAGSLTGSANHSWTNGENLGQAFFGQSMAGFSQMVVDLGSPGSDFTFKYEFGLDLEMLGTTSGSLFYTIALGETNSWFKFLSIQDSFSASSSTSSQNTLFSDSTSGSFSGNSTSGNLSLFIDIQLSGGHGGPFFDSSQIDALGTFSFDITNSNAPSPVPAPSAVFLLLPGLMIMFRKISSSVS